MAQFDAVILGAGMAGLGAAPPFAEDGKKDLIIYPKGITGQSSPAAGGILDPLLELSPESPLLDLTLKAFENYSRVLSRLGIRLTNDIRYAKTGMLYLALDRNETEGLQDKYRWQKKTPIPVRWLNAKQAEGIQSGISSSVKAALFYPTIAKLNPALLVQYLRQRLKRLKVQFRTRAAAACLIIEAGGRVAGVRVDGVTFQSGCVINAAGVWAGINRDDHLRMPVQPIRGQIIVMRGKLNLRTILHSMDGGYIVPWGDNEFLLGSTVEEAGYRAKVTAEGLDGIMRRCRRIFPAVSEMKQKTVWAGLRPRSADRMPIMGEDSEVRGLFHLCGYYRNGILISFLCGQELYRMMQNAEVPTWLVPFSPARFARRRTSSNKL